MDKYNEYKCRCVVVKRKNYEIHYAKSIWNPRLDVRNIYTYWLIHISIYSFRYQFCFEDVEGKKYKIQSDKSKLKILIIPTS